MSKAIFSTAYTVALPIHYQSEGEPDDITNAGRVGTVPVPGVSTDVIIIESTPEVIAIFKADPAYLLVEEL